MDSNIFIYASGNPHPCKNLSLQFLTKIAKGQIKALISAEVLQEILHRYCAINDRGRGFAVFDDCLQIITVVLPLTKQDVLKARGILQEYPLIDARDAAHTAVMLNREIQTICSYDKHYDQIKEIKRIEP